jgi:phosphoribosylaminoimidazole carboxylase PurE protein
MPRRRSGRGRGSRDAGPHPEAPPEDRALPDDAPAAPRGEEPEAPGDRVEVDTRRPVVGVAMGSDSDLPIVQGCLETLEEFDVSYEVRVLSAHRTPELAHQYASTARLNGLKILVAAAGGAAHLAGVLASLTTLPVIGIPILTPTLGGADSLYSTVQMPAGVPVATVAIGKAGATNAALLAVEILALSDETLHHRLQRYRADLRTSVAKKNEALRETLAGLK